MALSPADQAHAGLCESLLGGSPGIRREIRRVVVGSHGTKQRLLGFEDA